jgi:hypothetical protein
VAHVPRGGRDTSKGLRILYAAHILAGGGFQHPLPRMARRPVTETVECMSCGRGGRSSAPPLQGRDDRYVLHARPIAKIDQVIAEHPDLAEANTRLGRLYVWEEQ